MRSVATCATAVALVLRASLGLGQQNEPYFRSAINLVEVDFRAFDRRGEFVNDLSADVLAVLEDGIERPIAAVRLIDLAADGAVSPSTIDPRAARVMAPDHGRFYLLLLDDLNTYELRGHATRAIARTFIETRLGGADLAAVVVTSGGSPYQDLTSNKTALLDAIDKFTGKRAGLIDSWEQRLGIVDRSARSVFRQIRTLAGALPRIDGRRKAIVYISEGTRGTAGSRFDDSVARQLETDFSDAVDAAIRNNVGIYVIDPTGLPTGKKGLIRPIADDPKHAQAFHGLYALATETGGMALFNSNDPTPLFDRIVADSTRYYLLTYYGPPVTSARRTYRRIEVRTSMPDVRIDAREGYYTQAPQGGGRPAR